MLNSGRSTVEAYARFSPGTSKWTKHTIAEHVSIGGNGPILVGTPSQVADGLETWIKEADVDGFNFVSTFLPVGVDWANFGRLTRFSLNLSKTSSSSFFPNCEIDKFSGKTTRYREGLIARISTVDKGRKGH